MGADRNHNLLGKLFDLINAKGKKAVIGRAIVYDSGNFAHSREFFSEEGQIASSWSVK
jgi:hypothetical protein